MEVEGSMGRSPSSNNTSHLWPPISESVNHCTVVHVDVQQVIYKIITFANNVNITIIAKI